MTNEKSWDGLTASEWIELFRRVEEHGGPLGVDREYAGYPFLIINGQRANYTVSEAMGWTYVKDTIVGVMLRDFEERGFIVRTSTGKRILPSVEVWRQGETSYEAWGVMSLHEALINTWLKAALAESWYPNADR